MLNAVELSPENPTASIVWLHGLGADGNDFVPIVQEMQLDHVRYVFPHADVRPVTINAGMQMRAWYDIQALDLDARSHDEVGIRKSEQQVRALLDREIERGIPASRIVLAGFSQGGAMALHTGVRYEHELAGIIALSCYLLLPEQLADEAHEANAKTPIFFGHGSLDPVVPLRAGQLAQEFLDALGYSTQWRTYPVQHGVHPQEISDVRAFLVERLQVS